MEGGSHANIAHFSTKFIVWSIFSVFAMYKYGKFKVFHANENENAASLSTFEID